MQNIVFVYCQSTSISIAEGKNPKLLIRNSIGYIDLLKHNKQRQAMKVYLNMNPWYIQLAQDSENIDSKVTDWLN